MRAGQGRQYKESKDLDSSVFNFDAQFYWILRKTVHVDECTAQVISEILLNIWTYMWWKKLTNSDSRTRINLSANIKFS